jgi:protein SCO1/2
MTSTSRVVTIAITVLFGSLIGWWGSGWLLQDRPALVPLQIQIGGPFTLVGPEGRTMTDADFRGRPMLVAFGYTNCPDVCPLILNAMGEAFDALGADAQLARGVFVSVDPQRDTPERLKDYVEAISPNIVGLTGTREQIDAVVRAYRAMYRIAPDAATNPHYTVDHSTLLYLMDGQGRFVAHFSHQTQPAAIAEAIRRSLRQS